MGIFGDQSERLLRESWSSVDELAEELYALFNSDDTLQISSPVAISTPQGSTVPPLSLESNGISPDVLTWTAVAVPSTSLGSIPPLPALPQIGGISIGGLSVGGVISAGSGPDPTQPPAAKPASQPSGGGGLPGQVMSGGPGKGPYTVQVYPDGPDQPFQTVQATQLQIADAETIPAGTWTVVIQVGKTFYMQVPVWQGGAP